MDQRAPEVRQDIERTRAALTSKIEMLDARVRGSVEETKNRVKQSVSPRHHMQQHPWSMIGISILTGYMLERFMASRSVLPRANGRLRKDRSRVLVIDAPLRRREESLRSRQRRDAPVSFLYSQAPEFGAATYQPEREQAERAQRQRGLAETPEREQSATEQPPEAEAKRRHGIGENVVGQLKGYGQGAMDDITHQFKRELDTLKGAAVGAVASLVRDMVKQAAPVAGSYAKQVLDTASTKLTGHPLPTSREGATAAPEEQRTAQAEQRASEALHRPA